MICGIAIGGLALAALFISPRNVKAYVYEGENVLLSKLEPFWVRNVTLTSAGPYSSSYNFETEIYLMNCSDLYTTTTHYSFSTSGTQSTFARDITVNIPLAPDGRYQYFLPGESIVNFSILIQSDTTYTSCISELNIYDNYDEFLVENGISTIQTDCVVVHKPPITNSTAPTIVSFKPTKESFYFATLSVPPSATYFINVTVDKSSHFTNDSFPYMDRCILSSTEVVNECIFSLLASTDIILNLDPVCILATTQPLPPIVDPSFVKVTITSTPNIFRNIAYLSIPGLILIYLVVCLIVWACYKTCVACCYKCKIEIERNSTHEYATI